MSTATTPLKERVRLGLATEKEIAQAYERGECPDPYCTTGSCAPDAPAFDCGHQGETDCHGQCAIREMYDALVEAFQEGSHDATCNYRIHGANECNCWKATVALAIARAEEE